MFYICLACLTVLTYYFIGATMEDLLGRLLSLRCCKYIPQHKNNLANEFRCFANYNLDDFMANKCSNWITMGTFLSIRNTSDKHKIGLLRFPNIENVLSFYFYCSIVDSIMHFYLCISNRMRSTQIKSFTSRQTSVNW